MTLIMAADARWLKLKLRWQSMSREKQDRALGLLFIIAVAFIWVYLHFAPHKMHDACSPRPTARSPLSARFVQVLASFLVQDLEAQGLNPFLLTYIANSLFIVYLPAYALVKHFAAHGLKGRQALLRPHCYCESTLADELHDLPISGGCMFMCL